MHGLSINTAEFYYACTSHRTCVGSCTARTSAGGTSTCWRHGVAQKRAKTCPAARHTRALRAPACPSARTTQPTYMSNAHLAVASSFTAIADRAERFAHGRPKTPFSRQIKEHELLPHYSRKDRNSGYRWTPWAVYRRTEARRTCYWAMCRSMRPAAVQKLAEMGHESSAAHQTSHNDFVELISVQDPVSTCIINAWALGCKVLCALHGVARQNSHRIGGKWLFSVPRARPTHAIYARICPWRMLYMSYTLVWRVVPGCMCRS